MYVVWLIHISEITALSAIHFFLILVGASEKVEKVIISLVNPLCTLHYVPISIPKTLTKMRKKYRASLKTYF